MFSGLIQGMGTVWTNTGPRIAVVAPVALRLKEGASVAVNGVCLTVVKSQRRAGGVLHNFDVSAETLAKTTLGRLKAGTRVNLEPALTLKDSLGGHIVQGHVDGVGRVAAVNRQGPNVTVQVPTATPFSVMPRIFYSASSGPQRRRRSRVETSRDDGAWPASRDDGVGWSCCQGMPQGPELSLPNTTIWFSVPRALERYLVSKGSVAIDGVSLTVARITGGRFSVALIPYTLVHTNMGVLRPGDTVNLEADIIAKYVEKYTRGRRR